jgi:TrmH family RNA methyltransferase
MPIKRITSRDNPFFRELLDLAESRRARRERMQTILDGEHLLTEAIQAGVAPVHIVVTEALVERAAWEPAGWLEKLPQVPITQMPASLFNRLSPVATPSGILSVIGIPVPERCPDPQFAVLLEDIQEPGNLGALLRTAAAAGVAISGFGSSRVRT